MDFDEIEGGDWKTRLKAYENIIQMMANPTPELMNQLQNQLPVFLSDVNPTCQKTAINICDMFFKSNPDINYTDISRALIDRCLGARQQNSDAAVPLVLQCLKNNREHVYEMLFNKLPTKPPKHILAVISVIIAHLASLTSKDSEEAETLIKQLQPLLTHNDPTIQKEAASAIASAKIVCGQDLDTTDGSHYKSPRKENGSPSKNSSFFDDENNWSHLIQSQMWKERKSGYEILLNSINPDFPLLQYENQILGAINEEKHVACNEVAVQVIEKLALTFKTQLSRRLREYITPVINVMKEKRQTRFSNIQSSFDAVVMNATSGTPYEQPILDYLLKMLTNQSVRLREEAVAFIIRCPIQPVPASIQNQLVKLTEDPNLSVRDVVAKALAKIGGQKPSEIKIPEPQLQKARQRARSPDTRRSVKRKPTTQLAVNIWPNWVDEETLTLLNSNQWNQVTAGLEQLRKQFDDDPSCPHAVVAGISQIFVGKTFTPKVMINIVKDILYYIQSDPSKITDDALNMVLHFTLDKIQDKKLESSLFELLDALCECNSGQYVFSFFYNQLSAKNPVIPARIVTYFAHYISMQGDSCDIDLETLSVQIKPLFQHSDQSVRKAAQECYSSVIALGPEALEYFKYVKPPQAPQKKFQPQHDISPQHENDLEKVTQINEVSSDIIDSPPFAPPAPKPKSRASEIPVPKRSQSPKRNQRPVSSPEPKSARKASPEKSLFSNKLLQAVTKSGSILECKRGFDELEGMLNKMVEKGPTNSIPFGDFSELFIRMKQWLRDTNATILLPLSKCIGLSLKLIKVSDISLIPNDFLSDMILLLNFSSKAIKNSCISNMNALYSMLPSFIPDVFIPMFHKLSAEAKLTALKYFCNLNIDMDVPTYGSFIVQCLSNKSEEFKEAVTPICMRYLQLPGAQEEIERDAEQFAPAKKVYIKSQVSQLIKQGNQLHEQKIEAMLFKQPPTEEDKKDRMQTVDPFLPLKILNSDEQPESLGELLQNLAETYFPSSVLSTDPDAIATSCKLFIEIAKQDFNGLSLVLDIVFMWWANQALFIRQQAGFTEIINFLESLILILADHNRILSQYEISLILPTVLECMGRYPDMWRRVQDLIFGVCENSTLLTVLVRILAIASSVFALSATFNALMEIIPLSNAEKYYSELKQTTAKILSLVSSNKEQNPELYETATEFTAFLNELTSPQKQSSPNKQQQQKEHQQKQNEHKQKEINQRQQQQQQQNEQINEEQAKEVNVSSTSPQKEAPKSNIPSPSQNKREISVCFLNDAIIQQKADPSYEIYEQLANLISPDYQLAIKSLKYISALLKTNENILRPHLEYLIVSLILKIHVREIPAKDAPNGDLPLKHFKHTLLCILTLFNESKLYQAIKKEYIQQIVYEMLTHLSNGSKEPKLDKVITDVLNAIIVKLIDECTMYAFMALLAAIGEFDSNNEFSDKWLRLAIKCFEACGERICEVGNHIDICNTFSLIDQFFEMHDISHIDSARLGIKVFTAIKKYGVFVMSKYGDMIRSKESLKKLGPNSIILKLVSEQQPQQYQQQQPQVIQVSGIPQSKLKPLRQ